MRLRLSWSRCWLFAAMFLAALLFSLPLRLAVGWFADLGITARHVGGSVWNGRLSEAHFANLSIGDLHARLSPLAVAMGRAHLEFARHGEPAEPLRGAISVGRNRVGIEDVTAKVPLGSAFAPLPLLALDLSDVSARFVDGICETADGRVRAEIDGAVLGLALSGGLSGNVRCDGGVLLLPLVSQSALESVSLRLFANSRYVVDFIVRPADPAGRDRLLATGFTPGRDGYKLSVNGSL